MAPELLSIVFFLLLVLLAMWYRHCKAVGRPWFRMGGARKPQPLNLKRKLPRGSVNFTSQVGASDQVSADWALAHRRRPATARLRRLTELTHDEEVSRRLVENMVKANPDQSYEWCVERAYELLLRDRGAR